MSVLPGQSVGTLVPVVQTAAVPPDHTPVRPEVSKARPTSTSVRADPSIPQDGVRTVSKPSQQPQPTTIPTTQPLEIHLYAPSRTAGFVKPGQAVLLRYAAFPYQKFGLQQGWVQHISRTPISPQDLPQGSAQAIQQQAQSAEPLYRVAVRMERSHISAYGEQVPLKPGMAVEADVLQDRRAIWEWVLEPVIAARANVSGSANTPIQAPMAVGVKT
jgi:multidrug efflux pump subunit AcrA (membrane-fusion protein)